MSAAEVELIRAMQARDEAKAALAERLGLLSGALAEHGIGERVKHEAVARAQGVAGETLAVARQSRWIVVATLVMLLGWVLRRPIAAAARNAADRFGRREPRSSWGRLREWTLRKAKL